MDISGSQIQFEFRGKSGKHHAISIRDRRLAKIVKRCRDIPGYELFQYLDQDGQRQTIDSGDVNDYLQEITGEEFTAKDFRTWAGTVLATATLQALEDFSSETQAQKNITQMIKTVAQQLGNTTTVCRKYYVHPAVIDLYQQGTLQEILAQEPPKQLQKQLKDLEPEELALIALLKQRLDQKQA